MNLATTSTLLALLFAAQAQAQSPAQPGFEHVLPAGTFAFMGMSDVDGARSDFAESSWGRLWADPACDSMRVTMEQQWKQLGDMVKEKLGIDVLGLMDMVHGPFAVAVTSLPDPALDNEGSDAEGFGAALLVDFGEDLDEARLIVEQLVDRAGEKAGAMRASESISGTEVTLLQPDGDIEPESLSIRVAFHGSTLVVVLGALEPQDDVMESVLQALDGDGDDVLADAAAFRGSVASQPGGFSVWADLSQLVTMGLASARADAQDWAEDGVVVEDADSPIDGLTMTEFVDKLGLSSLGSLALHSAVDARGMRWNGHISMPGNGWVPGMLRMLLGPVATGHPGLVTADCRNMMAWHVDFPGLFDESLAIMLESGMFAPDELAGNLASMEEDLGFDLREDLLALLDGQVTAIIDDAEPGEALPGTEAAPMNFALIFGLTDSKLFNGVLEDLIRSRGMHAGRQRLEFQGYEIYNVPLPPVALQYCVLPDALVVSLSSTMLQDVLRHRASPDLPSVGNSDAYKAALARLGTRPGMLSYADAGRSTAIGLESITTSLAPLTMMFGDDPEIAPFMSFIDAMASMKVPDAAVVEKYIHGGSIATVTADESGITIDSFQP